MRVHAVVSVHAPPLRHERVAQLVLVHLRHQAGYVHRLTALLSKQAQELLLATLGHSLLDANQVEAGRVEAPLVGARLVAQFVVQVGTFRAEGAAAVLEPVAALAGLVERREDALTELCVYRQ